MRYRFFSSGVIILCFLLSCRSSRPGEAEQAGEDRILFVNLFAARDTAPEQVRLRILTTLTVKGRLKHMDDMHETPGMLRCTFLDSTFSPVERIYARDPLVRQVERLAKDGSFERSELRQDSARFSLRVPFRGGMHFLRIEKLISPDSLLEWGIVPLTENK